MSDSKQCRMCEETKPIEEFGVQNDKRYGPGRRAICKPCKAKRDRLEWRRKNRGRLCNGRGNTGGPTHNRTCPICQTSKANTAFTMGHDVCTKCENATNKCTRCRARNQAPGYSLCLKCRECHGGPPGVVHHQDVQSSRVPLADWMVVINASEADWSIVRTAMARYGKTKSKPSADQVIEEYVGGYETHEQKRRYGQLAHALALMANELHMRTGGRMVLAGTKRGRRGPASRAAVRNEERAA